MPIQNLNSLLQIELVRGKNLKNAELMGTSDPYCVIEFDDEEQAQPMTMRSEVFSNDLQPEFDEKFFTLISDDMKSFAIKVYDKNVLLDKSLGNCRIARPQPGSRHQRTGGWQVLDEGKNGQLEVYVTEISLSQLPSLMNKNQHEFGHATRDYSYEFALLDVRIESGKDLKAADYNGKSDPYAKIRWDKHAKVFPRKVQTSTVAKSLNPTWDSTFYMLVDPTSTSSFKVEIVDKDIIDDSMGHVNVPLNDVNVGAENDYAVVKGQGTLRIAHCLVPLSALF